MSLAEYSISATDEVDRLQCNRVGHVVTLPDWAQLSLHKYLNEGLSGIRLINCGNANQCQIVATGLRLGGRRPPLATQSQDLHNCINSLRAVGLDTHIPLVLMVGQFGREHTNFGHPSTISRRVMVNGTQFCGPANLQAPIDRCDFVGPAHSAGDTRAVRLGVAIGWATAFSDPARSNGPHFCRPRRRTSNATHHAGCRSGSAGEARLPFRTVGHEGPSLTRLARDGSLTP